MHDGQYCVLHLGGRRSDFFKDRLDRPFICIIISREQRVGELAGCVRNAIYSQLGEIDLLGMRAQCVLQISKEVFTDLSFSQLVAKAVVSVDTAARLIELDYHGAVARAEALAIETAIQVTVQAFGSKNDNDIDYMTVSSEAETIKLWFLPEKSEMTCCSSS